MTMEVLWIVLGGVLLSVLLGWWWIDSIAALGLVYFVVHEGWEASFESWARVRNERTPE
jgi:divalent metal cation (Fe/Co/Zn/Cd) transporter